MVGMNTVLRGASPVVIALVVIAIILGVGSQVIDTSKEIYNDNDATVSTTNESLTVVFNTFQQLDRTVIANSSVVVSNSTIGILSQGSWEMSNGLSLDGQINISDVGLDGTVVNITYDSTSRNKNAAFNASEYGLDGLNSFSGFQPSIAIIVIAVLVIALLLVGFAAVGMRIN